MINPEAENFKRRVKDACDIVQVVSEHVNLVRAGRNFKGLCPLHQEKTPSFNVNPEGQFFKCFGCGKGGDVFTFVMETERCDFPQALALLAERARIPMPEYHSGRSPDEARLYEEGKNLLYRLNEFAASFFEEQLWSEAGAKACEYLDRRGLTEESARKFRVGYAPDSWDALCNQLARRKASERHMVAAGLAIERKDATGVYDRFRNRLIFPITNISGRCVGFGARALAETDNPKYLNSPETSVFTKSRLLFGLSQAREAIGDDRRVLMMEGYTDVLMAVQKGFSTAVATLGTALTLDHLRVLRRFADSALLVYDSDTAGLAAAERGLDLFFAEELPARVVTLEEGLDPCDYLIKRGPEAFAERLDAAVDLFDFKLSAVKAQHDLSTAHGRRAAVRALMDTVARVADPIMAAELRRRAAEAFGLPEEVLAAELAGRGRPARRSSTSEPGESPAKLSRRRNTERELAKALIFYPAGLQEASKAMDGFSDVQDGAAAELLRVAMKVYEDLGELNLMEVFNMLSNQDAVSLAAEFSAQMETYAPSDPAGNVSKILSEIVKFGRDEEVAKLLEAKRSASADQQLEISDRIAELKRLTTLEEKLDKLEDALFRASFDERKAVEDKIAQTKSELESLVGRPAGVAQPEPTEG